MTPDEFYDLRASTWKELDGLIKRSESALQQLTPEQVLTLGQLYRAVTSDLAFAQREFPKHRVTAYLNQLTGRGHNVVYKSEPLEYNRFVQYVTKGLPQVFRETIPFTIISFLMFIVPAVVVGILAAQQPDSARWLLPAEVQQLIPIMEEKELWIDIPVSESPYASSFIMQNNIRVSILAFAGGVILGIVTTWVLAFNGLIVGGLVGLATYYGVGFELLTFMIGHGVIELSVIFMAGGTGLQIAWAILHPGLLRRRDALALAGRRAVKLLMGCVALLVVAGTIEGFISPNPQIPWWFKWMVGIGSGALMYAYLLLSGRERKPIEYKSR
jgi:uncharacterized membrane protein SpoIIM required for sporulation